MIEAQEPDHSHLFGTSWLLLDFVDSGCSCDFGCSWVFGGSITGPGIAALPLPPVPSSRRIWPRESTAALRSDFFGGHCVFHGCDLPLLCGMLESPISDSAHEFCVIFHKVGVICVTLRRCQTPTSQLTSDSACRAYQRCKDYLI